MCYVFYLFYVVKADSDLKQTTTLSMCIEMQNISKMLGWFKQQEILRRVCVTDSISILVKVQISTGKT